MMLLDLVPKGADPPRIANAIIETPLGSRIKYAAAEAFPAMHVSKLLAPALAYPADTGYFARCWGEDDDPLDAMVLGDTPIAVGAVASVRPIAVLRVLDRGKRDDKVVCVLEKDPAWRHAKTLTDIPPHVRKAFDAFHATYRRQEGTQRLVQLEGWSGSAAAKPLVEAGHVRFAERQARDKKKPPA